MWLLKYGWEVIKFYGRCVATAFGGAYGAVSWVSTALALFSGLVQEHQPHWMNARYLDWVKWIGGWDILAFIFIGVVSFRLVLAPYWIYREQKEKLESYDLGPEVHLLEPEKDDRVCVSIVNKRDVEERALSIRLEIMKNGEPPEIFRRIESLKRAKEGHHAMPPRSSFEVTFALMYCELALFHSAISVCPVVEMEDGRLMRGNAKKLLPVFKTVQASGSIAEFLEKKNRVNAFVKRATVNFRGDYHPIRDLANAGILSLQSSDEVREACDLLMLAKVPIPFDDSDHAKDVLAFYRQFMAPKPGTKTWNTWREAYAEWFGKTTVVTPLSQAADKVEPTPEPSSPECPEKDTRCYDY